MEPSRVRTLTLSTGLLQPFLRLLSNYQLRIGADLERFRALGPTARLPVNEALAQLEAALELAEDPDLGLKAGRLVDFEDAGLLAYCASSAASLRDALTIAERYLTLLSDATECKLLVEGPRALLRLDSKVPLPRASEDFQASALQTHYRRTHNVDIPELEWWFTHERPASTREYERTFGNAILRFSMPCFACSFPAHVLDLPLCTADARQHAQLLPQMESALAGVPRTESMSERVRETITRYLPTGQLKITVVAHEFHMSRRTLARRLFDEGTSFTAILDDTRRRLALHYLENTDRTVAQIAILLGFSEVATFYRAFRRWHQKTPIKFRHAQREGINLT